MKRSNYAICSQDGERVLIQDLGPWDQFNTVTNDAENVVAQLAPMLKIAGGGYRRLEYIDSEGYLGELRIDKFGKFCGF